MVSVVNDNPNHPLDLAILVRVSPSLVFVSPPSRYVEPLSVWTYDPEAIAFVLVSWRTTTVWIDSKDDRSLTM